MRFDLNLVTAAIAEMPARIEQARAAGYDGVFVAETRQDPFLPLAAAARLAPDMDLGTSIALAFPRSPMTMAMSAWGLQAAQGRFILGLGSQVRRHIERRFSSAYDRPVARLTEYVRGVRHCWAAFQGQHRLKFDGEFYHLDFLPDFGNPGPIEAPPPPIFLATVGPAMYRTAGAVADGAFVHPLHTVDYLKNVAIPAIESGRSQQDEQSDPDRPFSLSVTVFTVVGTGSDAERAREAVRAQLAFYGSTPTYRDVLAQRGWQDTGARLQELVKSGRHAEMPALVSDAMLEDFTIVADTWPQAATLARHRYNGLADRISFYNPPPAGQAIT